VAQAVKIAHLPFCYYPDAVGGTEVYVHGLALELQRAGHEVFIVAPAAEPASYQHDGLTVHRFRVDAAVTEITEMYAANESVDAAGFIRIMEAEAPDILHVHGYTRAVSKRILDGVKSRGIRIVFTYHTPTATCVRGTLMRWGHTSCDGGLNATRCAACSLQARGLPRVAAEIVARLPRGTGRALPGGPIATATRMRELVELRHEGIREFLGYADRVVAPSDWVAKLLEKLDVPPAKIVRSRQGTQLEVATQTRERAAGPVRTVFFARIDRTKGLHILLDALSRARDLEIELHVYGIIQDNDTYAHAIQRRAAQDPRVRLHGAIPHSSVHQTLRQYDVAVIPSQTLETGPLSVLEAFAAGVPVVGSRLGGISELVRDEVDGLLVTPRDVRAWAAALRRLVSDPVLLEKLRTGVAPPRTTTIVAREMELVYRAVLDR
jgi:glycosyltransferase involved in cell wall biosynthesis